MTPKPTQRHTSPPVAKPPVPTDLFRPVVTRVTLEDVRWTWREGCPVGPSRLRKITMGYRGYDGLVHRGVLIVAADEVTDMVAVFRAAFDAGFRIRRMDNPNLWHGDDEAMMAADNTSAFNCRQVVGNTSRVSPHSYGYAFDVNPLRNPYLAADGVWYPPNGSRWIDRSLRDAGMVRASSAITRAVLARGGTWGGAWGNPDYQHYELR